MFAVGIVIRSCALFYSGEEKNFPLILWQDSSLQSLIFMCNRWAYVGDL